MRYTLLLIVFLITGCETPQSLGIKIPLDKKPEINFFVLGKYTFEITPQGKVEWNIWSEQCPSEKGITFQFSNMEYQKALSLASRVFENNLEPYKTSYHDIGYEIYEIKLGQYFSSVSINIIVNSDEEIPDELSQFMKYIDTLVQPNQQLKAGTPSRDCASAAH